MDMKKLSSINSLTMALLLVLSFFLSSPLPLLAKTSFKHNLHNSPEEMNQKFKKSDFNVQEFIDRFEAEDREVFNARDKIVESLDIKPGSTIADIGSGTGLFTIPLARATGDKGWTYAVDISPGFTEYVRKLSKKKKLDKITCVLSREDSVCLPPDSVDLAFVCNTYHHFGKADAVLKSIKHALRPGARLVVIDFDRKDGKSRKWVLKHIHKSKETVREEIGKNGLKFLEEKKLKELKENYFLIFEKEKVAKN